MAHDRVGSALALDFDLNNTLGFSSSQVISANTYNVTDRPAPLFTGLNQTIRTLPASPFHRASHSRRCCRPTEDSELSRPWTTRSPLQCITPGTSRLAVNSGVD